MPTAFESLVTFASTQFDKYIVNDNAIDERVSKGYQQRPKICKAVIFQSLSLTNMENIGLASFLYA